MCIDFGKIWEYHQFASRATSKLVIVLFFYFLRQYHRSLHATRDQRNIWTGEALAAPFLWRAAEEHPCWDSTRRLHIWCQGHRVTTQDKILELCTDPTCSMLWSRNNTCCVWRWTSEWTDLQLPLVHHGYTRFTVEPLDGLWLNKGMFELWCF